MEPPTEPQTSAAVEPEVRCITTEGSNIILIPAFVMNLPTFSYYFATVSGRLAIFSDNLAAYFNDLAEVSK